MCLSFSHIPPFSVIDTKYRHINIYVFKTKIPVELTEHDAFIFLDFEVREKASMNNSK